MNGTITTIVGNGSPGDSGDGGLAIHAQIGGVAGWPPAMPAACTSRTTITRRLWMTGVKAMRSCGPASAGSPRTGSSRRWPGMVVPVIPAMEDSRWPLDSLLRERWRWIAAAICTLRIAPFAKSLPRGSSPQWRATGPSRYIADAGPATSAGAVGAAGMAADPTGNLYIADHSQRIRSVPCRNHRDRSRHWPHHRGNISRPGRRGTCRQAPLSSPRWGRC